MKHLPFNTTFLVIAALIGILPFGAVWYLYTSLQNERVAIEELSVKAHAISEESDRLSSVRALVKETEGLRGTLDGYFLTDATVPEFLALIESFAVASTTRVEIRDVAVDAGTNKSSAFERIRFSVFATGGFSDVVHVVELVEALPYDVSIEELALDEAGDGQWRALVSTSVAKLKK